MVEVRFPGERVGAYTDSVGTRHTLLWGRLLTGWASEGVVIVVEAWEEQQKARKVLGAAVAEAEGKPDQHVFALPVMRRAGVTNAEFRAAARNLDKQGCIAQGSDDYETFVVTSEGVDRVTGGRDEVPDTPDTERPEPS